MLPKYLVRDLDNKHEDVVEAFSFSDAAKTYMELVDDSDSHNPTYALSDGVLKAQQALEDFYNE